MLWPIGACHRDEGTSVSSLSSLGPSPTVTRLPQELVDKILHLSAISTRQEYYAALRPSQSWRYTSHPPLSSSHLAKLCLVSRSLNETFTKVLYRSVVLSNDRTAARFAETVSSNPQLGRHVRHLVILAPDDLRVRPSLIGQARDGPSNPRRVDNDALTRYASEHGSGDSPQASVAESILFCCPNATHLLLSRSRFHDWSPGLYSMASAREITLLGVGRGSELDGLASRHRQNVTAALESNPTIQALLNTSSVRPPQRERGETGHSGGSGSSASASQGSSPMGVEGGASPEASADAASLSSSGSSGLADSRPHQPRPAPRLPLTHLHLVNFDGRLIHHLAQLTSLTHVVFSFPGPFASSVDDAGPLLPRSHLLLLLGSGRIRRIVIRASPSTCHRIMEEISPIRDEKLIFRPIKLKSAGQEVTSHRPRASSQSTSGGSSASHSTNGQGVQVVDLLAEWWERIHLDALQHRRGDRATAWASSGSSRERGDSLSSSEMEADSSWSDDRDRNSSGETGSGSGPGSRSGSAYNSGSYDSDVYSDDEGDYYSWPPVQAPPHGAPAPPFPRPFQDFRSPLPPPPLPVLEHANYDPRLAAGPPAAGPSRLPAFAVLPRAPGATGVGAEPMPALTAPPPQIPIETLLAYEDLEQARQRRDVGLMVPMSRRRIASRSDEEQRRIRPGVFAARRSDVRGATEAGLERLADVLARNAELQQADDPEAPSRY
ncbi:hypothetical protein ACQY0O_008428 [Thecaphora frezii]